MLRDLLDQFHLLRQIEEHGVRCYWRRWHPVTKWAAEKFGPDARTVVLVFAWPDDVIVLDVHFYITPGCGIAGTELMDPKKLRYSGEIRLQAIEPQSHMTKPDGD